MKFNLTDYIPAIAYMRTTVCWSPLWSWGPRLEPT